jgi:hypothetical protein
MKNWKIIKRVVLSLILSLAVMNAWSQICFEESAYVPGTPTDTGSPDQIELCDYQKSPEYIPVCVKGQADDGSLILIDGDCFYYIRITSGSLTDASFLLVLLLGIYGTYLYRKRVVLK